MIEFELCMQTEYELVHPPSLWWSGEKSFGKKKVRHVPPILLGWSSEKLEHVPLLKRMDHIRWAGNGQVTDCAC